MSTLWLVSLVVFVLTVALASLMGIVAAAIGDSVPDRQRPLAIGMWQFTANGLATFLMGRYILGLTDPGVHRVGFATVAGAAHWPYTVACCIFVVAAAIFVLVFRERYVPPRTGEKFRMFSYGRQIVQVREHLLIYVILLFQPMFVLVGSWYFPKLATERLGLSQAQYGSAHSWGGITVMAVCVPLGYLFSRIRFRRPFAMAACMMALVPITWGLFFMRTQAGIAFYFAAQQFAFAFFRLNFNPYIMEYTTPRSVGTIFGVTNAVNGIVRFTMIPLFGWLVDLMGKNYRLPLWGGYVGVVACVICLAMMRPPEKVRHLIDADPS
jgi:MFS family permease